MQSAPHRDPRLPRGARRAQAMASTPAAVVGDGSGAAVPQVAGGKSVLPKIAVPPDTPDLVAFDPDRDVKSPHAVL